MKIRHKFAYTVIAGSLAGLSLGFWGALLFHQQIHHSGFERLMKLIAPVAVIFFFIVLAFFAFKFRKAFFKAISDISNFTDSLGSGGTPEQLSLTDDDDISHLYMLLNYLRDRQQSLSAKLEAGIERESSLRREIEFYDALLIGALKQLLIETEQNLSVVKGLLLCNLDAGDLSAEQQRDFTLRCLRRIGVLNRETGLGSDLLYLDRNRISNRNEAEFSTSALYQEISNRTTSGFAARKISLSGSYNANVPGCLRADRELLAEILFLMLRTVGRITGSGGAVVFNAYGKNRKVVFEVAVEHSSPTLEMLAENYGVFAAARKNTTDKLPENSSINVIGLEIIRQIAEYTGSPFAVDSDERYSTRLTLVLDKAFENDSGRSNAIGSFGSSPFISTADSAAKEVRHSIRILLADADPDECLVLKQLMKRENIELSTADNEKSLLATMAELPFDGVLLAPPFSGKCAPELIRKLRKAANWSRLPAIIISPEISDDLQAELDSMTRVEHLDMPLNYEQLARLIQSKL